MVTKKQLAKMIMIDFAGSEGLRLEDINQGEIFKSSSLAVAMEYLGLLDGNFTAYASERGGTILSCYDKENDEMLYLSTRELFDLLPEEGG